MKSNIETLSKLERKLNIAIPADQVDQAYTKVYKELQKKANIDGFRKGKAPLDKIKSLYKEKVKPDVLQDLVSTYYTKALDEHKLSPISWPAFDIEESKLIEATEFNFTAKFEIKPEVKIGDVSLIEVEKEKIKVTDKMLDEEVKWAQQSKSELKPVLEERPLKKDDFGVIDFEGFMEGKLKDEACGKDYPLLIGGGQFIPGFEDGLLGMKVNEERSLNLSFPEKYHNTDLAAKPVEFKVKLKEIKKRILPELNDEFVKTLGNYSSLEDYKQKVKESLVEKETNRIEQKFDDELVKKLIEQNPVEAPESMVTEQKKILVDDFKRNMAYQGMNESQFDEYQEKWDKDFQATATQVVQSTFLINQLALDLKLKIEPADFEKQMIQIAGQANVDVEMVKKYYQTEEQKTNIYFQITKTKVMDYLKSKVKTKLVDPPKKEETKEATEKQK